MRNNKILIVILAATMLVASESCKKGFLEGVNDNPNSPAAVIPSVLLPGAEGNLAYAKDGDMGRYAAIMTQYVTGATRQFFGYNQYTFSEEDFNNLWNNLYAATMKNFKGIMDINADPANAGGYDAYDGVARILMAYTMGMTTDAWGDVPYSEAFEGNENLTPHFDSQEDVYASIQQLLSDGISILSDGDLIGDDFATPGSDDFIYSGDLDAWIAFAHALKARYFIHLTKVDPNAAANALAEINAGGEMQNAAYPFNSSGPGSWYQYIEQRDDIIYSEDNAYGLPDPACIGQMRSHEDPRVGVYVDLNGDYWGSGYLGPFFAADNSPGFLMCEFERLFIEAEAKLATGDNAGAQEAFTAGIQNSMSFCGIDAATADAYVAANGTLSGDQNAMLKQIMYEKWVANFLNPESWVDQRRTNNILGLQANGGGAGIPTRFIYPTNERLYNPNITDPNSNMFSPQLWWNP